MKEILLDQYNSTFDETHWFVCFAKAVEGLSAEQAAWKNEKIDHSIYGIVAHLVFWNERHLQKFNEKELAPVKGGNEGTFIPEVNLSWEKLLEKADNIFTEWKMSLRSCTEEKLNEKFNKMDDTRWHSIISHSNTHNAYHIGQIVLLRKLQGSWDHNKGVK